MISQNVTPNLRRIYSVKISNIIHGKLYPLTRIVSSLLLYCFNKFYRLKFLNKNHNNQIDYADLVVMYTHETQKLLQVCKKVVTSLFTSCQQVVFVLLVPSLL